MKDPKGPCAGLFSKGNGLDLLNKLEKKGKIKIADTKVRLFGGPEQHLVDRPDVGGVTKGDTIYLNPTNSVTKGTYPYNHPTAVLSGLTPVEGLAAHILHELLHVSGDFKPESKPEESYDFTGQVTQACFPKSGP